MNKFFFTVGDTKSKEYTKLGDAYGDAMDESNMQGSEVLVTLYVQEMKTDTVVELAKFRNRWEVRR